MSDDSDMATHLTLTVITSDTCSLCHDALDRLALPASLFRVRIATQDLSDTSDPDRFTTRTPVVIDIADRVVAEGAINAFTAFRVVAGVRFRRTPR